RAAPVAARPPRRCRRGRAGGASRREPWATSGCLLERNAKRGFEPLGADPVTEIAEAFAGAALGGEDGEELAELLRHLGIRHAVDQQGVEARALEITADEKRVEAGHAADDADIAGIGAGAAIGAAGDADTEPLVLEAVALELLRDAVDQWLAHALRLGERQAAGRQRR